MAEWLCEQMDDDGTIVLRRRVFADTWHEARLDFALDAGMDDFDRRIRCTRSVASKRRSR